MLRKFTSSLAILLIASVAVAQTPADLGRATMAAQQFEKQGKLPEALESYKRCLELATKLFGPDHKFVAVSAASAGGVCRQLGRYEEAEKYLEQALAASEKGQVSGLIVESANNLAACKFELGKYDDALALHQKCVRQFESLTGAQSSSTAISRANLAGVYEALGQSKQAESLYLRSIQDLEKKDAKESATLPSTISSLANLYLRQGEFARAEPLMARAVQLQEQRHGPEHLEVARLLNNQAALFANLGRFAQAEVQLERVIAITEKSLGLDHVDISRSLTNLAVNKTALKKFDQVEPLLARALAIRERALGKEHAEIALVLQQWGVFLIDQKRLDEAEPLIRRALAVREQALGPDHLLTAQSVQTLGSIFLRRGNKAEAERLLTRAFNIRREQLGDEHPITAASYAELAWLYQSSGRTKEAVDAFDRSRRGIRHYADQALSVLSEAEQLQFLEQFDRPRYETAFSAALADRATPLTAEISAGWVLNVKGMTQQTLARRVVFNRESGDPFVAKKTRELFAVRRQLGSAALAEGKSGDAARKQQFARLVELEAKLSQELNRAGALAGGDGEYVSAERVRKVLPAQSMLVEIARFHLDPFVDPSAKDERRERYAAWLIPPDGRGQIKLIDLGPVEPIDAAATQMRTALNAAGPRIRELGEDGAERELRQTTTALTDLLWKPLAADLQGVRELIISPDAALWLVPWSALTDRDEYLIERFAVRFVVSGRDLVRPAAAASPNGAVIVADPNYDLEPADVRAAVERLFRKPSANVSAAAIKSVASTQGAVERLSGTKAEAELVRPKIESLVKAAPLVYMDEFALESLVKAIHKPQVLLLSTHGFFHDAGVTAAQERVANPLLRCGLLFAGCNRTAVNPLPDWDDGIMTALEIAEVDLAGTELVVLSACGSGVGEVRVGEGVAGLRQSFQIAGARSVVSTLWSIPDAESAKLMNDFFAALSEGKSRADSLQFAQRQRIQSRRERRGAAHPFFWAAWTVTGE